MVKLPFQHLFHFNSIKVRLEPADPSGTQVAPDVFQFHKGTIRT